MDEFGSPILGGVNAVRRTVSSSMFAPRQPQRQPDSITTNLLSQQSLQLTSVSQQLERISTQVTSLNSSLSGVRENLVVSGQIDRQREAAKQKRERILAEQGLREGKESALEAKIQNALVQPLQKVAIKTQGTLGNLKKFLLILAGGWLTNTGIDLIKAQSEGNTEKLNELKAKFVSGLLVIGGTITALSIGIKNSFRLLGVFVNSISRVAFGGLLKTSLGGLRRLFSGAAAQAAGSVAGNLLTKSTKVLTNIGKTGFTSIAAMELMRKGKDLMNRDAAAQVTQKVGNRSKQKLMQQTKGQKLLRDARTPAAKGQGFLSGIGKRARNITKKIVGKGKNITAGLAGPKSLGAAANPTKKGFGRLLSMLGIKGGLKQAFKRFGGPVATLIINLATGDSLGKALAATAGYAAASAAAAKLLSPLLLAPIPGARILYGILVLAGGIVGESAIRGLYDGIAGLFGFGKKDKTDKEIKAKGNSQLLNKSNNEDMTYDGLEIVPISDISLEDQEKMGLIEPVKSNASEKANEISDMDEGQPAIINLPTSGSQPQVGGSNKIKKSEAATVPKIFFDNENPHTLYGAATYGVGN
tara:strand:+ start:119 stop:1873 length:1755 start_codon:yes stop_codon:yes gene_type:complete